VLVRPKFAARLSPEAREASIARLVAATEVVESVERVTECRDPSDDMVLEAALAAGVAVVVSDDRDLLVLDPWRGVRVPKPEAALALLGEGQG
jgi:putative PIN family toxin of toxin-antitoxin system